MNERTLTSLVDTLLAAVDGKADIDQRILLAQALQVIDRRLTALEGAKWEIRREAIEGAARFLRTNEEDAPAADDIEQWERERREEAGCDSQTDVVKASSGVGEPWPDPPPCPSAWWIHGPLWGQPCVEKGPHAKHRTALVNGYHGEWSDPDRGEIVPRDDPSPRCCSAMRDRAVAEIEREIASVQKIRRLSSDERDIAVEFLTYAANHVRALEVK